MSDKVDRNKPVDQPAFWRQRIEDSYMTGNIRHSVFKAPEHIWQEVKEHHRNILENIIEEGANVLDAGCGYGRASEIIPVGEKGSYVGVDQSPDFIDIAKKIYPGKTFICGDVSCLPFKDNEFDYSVCISLMIMIIQNLGWFQWEEMQNELLRVSKKGIICLEYGIADTNTTSDTYYLIRKG